jgi:hypothetical protein
MRKENMKFGAFAFIEWVQAFLPVRQTQDEARTTRTFKTGPLLRYIGAITHGVSDELLIQNIHIPEFKLVAELTAQGQSDQAIIQELAAEYTNGKITEARKIFRQSIDHIKQTARKMGIALEEDR